MKLSMTGQMRMDQRMKLAPRMIQSMEILQLPILALLEKIETELNENPTLEVVETQPESEQREEVETEDSSDSGESELIINEDGPGADDFERLSNFDGGNDDYIYRSDVSRSTRSRDEPDKKLEAMNNTADIGQSLHEYLTEQWRLVEADDKVRAAGQIIIDYIDDKGFLKVRLEQLHNKDKHNFGMEDLSAALELIQQLEPTGVGAADVKECLILQMDAATEDMSFEIELLEKYMDKLLENKLPVIAKKMNCSVDRINQAIQHMRKFDTSPGLLISKRRIQPIRPDVIVEPREDDGYLVYLAENSMPNLRINQFYADLTKDRKIEVKTRNFLQENIRSARWLMEAIEQRKNTLLRVSQAVVDKQKDFFDKGQMCIRPLPMSVIADEVGVHVATVSRAVAGKYIQSPQGLIPLRDLFGGGMETDDGSTESFEAIRAKMQQIIDDENKAKPLSDDAIKKELEKMGISNIARRTIAKYRKIMNIPTARFRKQY